MPRCGFLSTMIGVLAAMLLGGCAGRSAAPEAVLQPPETEVPSDWQPAEVKPNHQALARDLINQGHCTVAMGQLARAAEADPSAPEPVYLMGVCQRKTGNLPAAMDSFKRALVLDRNYAPAYHGMGLVYVEKKQTDQAHTNLLKAVALNPADADFLNDLGVLEMRMQRAGQALQRFEQCLQIAPDHIRAKNNLAECLVRLGRAGQALDFLKQHFPPAVAYNNLGGIYVNVGSFSKARSMFERALEYDPELTVARRNLNRLETKGNSQP
jgi:superkiller protein 3